MNTVIFLKHNVIHSASTDMLNLIDKSLPKDAHPDRKDSFLLSRMALKVALEKNHLSPAADMLIIDRHHELRFFPQIFVSLSHTKDAAIAWLRNRPGFGIDIERLDREIKEHTWQRVHHPEDSKNLTRLELWCLKEAAFKALSNAHHISGPIPFAEIKFEDNGVWKWENISGNYLTSIQENEWQCAEAWFD